MNDPEVNSNDWIPLQVTDRDGKLHQIVAPKDMGLNLMEALKVNELPIEGTCGGMALCGSCHIYIESDHQLSPVSPEEDEMLHKLYTVEDNSRLACQLRVDDRIRGLKITLAPE